MKKLNNRELFNLDQELFNFRGIDRAIWTRKAELMAKNGDDLVGGGKSGISKPTENTVMKFATDVTLKNLELFKENVESFKKQLTGEQLDIFYLDGGKQILIGKKSQKSNLSATLQFTASVLASWKRMPE